MVCHTINILIGLSKLQRLPSQNTPINLKFLKKSSYQVPPWLPETTSLNKERWAILWNCGNTQTLFLARHCLILQIQMRSCFLGFLSSFQEEIKLSLKVLLMHKSKITMKYGILAIYFSLNKKYLVPLIFFRSVCRIFLSSKFFFSFQVCGSGFFYFGIYAQFR